MPAISWRWRPGPCAFSSRPAPPILRSLGHLERFPETGNPGYFIVKLALWVLAVGVLAVDPIDAPS